MRRLLTLLFALVLLPAFAGCDSGDPTGTGPNGEACNEGTFTATVDGESFNAECVQINISNGLLTIGGITNLDGSDGPTQRFISIGGAQAQAGPQTPISASYAESSIDNPTGGLTCSAATISGAGGITLNVAEITDDSAKGTFSFTGTCFNPSGSVTVTNGQFDLSK